MNEKYKILNIINELDPLLRHPTRFSIITILLTSGPKTMGEIAKILNIDWGPLSTHVEKLKKEGYIRTVKYPTLRGPRRYLILTDKGAEKYREYIRKLDEVIRLLKNNQ